MADPFTNTYLTYSAKGLREDLSNIISDISPLEHVGPGK